MKRFSIATLMVVVLVCAVAAAALKNASDAWLGALLAITLLLLAISLVGTLHRRAARRAFWSGFAIFGWGYLTLAMGPWFAEQVGARLPTAQLLSYLHTKAHPDDLHAGVYDVMARTVLTDDLVLSGKPSGSRTRVVYQPVSPGKVDLWLGLTGVTNLDQFLRVGHCLFALLLALLGGLIARWFYRTNREGEEVRPSVPASPP